MEGGAGAAWWVREGRAGTGAMSVRQWVKAHLPYSVVCAIARTINRPFLEDIHRNERIVEYAWVLHHVRGPLIADVGCAGSYFAEMLCFFGNVVGIDPRPTPKITHPRFRRETKVSYGAPYDTVVCVSVLEHLPRTAAKQLIWQMVEALAPAGQCLITVPCGRERDFRGYQPFTPEEIAQWPGEPQVAVVTRHFGPNQEHRVGHVALVRLVRPSSAARPT